MKARTLQIKEALHSLKAAERAIEFQELALHLARRRWPDLVATERKADGGEDATAFQRNADGQLCRLACSLTGTLEKVRKDARRQQERGLKPDVLVFMTPEAISNLLWPQGKRSLDLQTPGPRQRVHRTGHRVAPPAA